MRPVKEIADAAQTRRVLICQRDDGLFVFVQEISTGSPPTYTAEPYATSAGLYDTAETAERAAKSRVEWLRKESSWPASHNPPMSVVPRQGTIIDCPFCGHTFLNKDPDRWGGGRHLTCGQRIDLID